MSKRGSKRVHRDIISLLHVIKGKPVKYAKSIIADDYDDSLYKKVEKNMETLAKFEEVIVIFYKNEKTEERFDMEYILPSQTTTGLKAYFDDIKFKVQLQDTLIKKLNVEMENVPCETEEYYESDSSDMSFSILNENRNKKNKIQQSVEKSKIVENLNEKMKDTKLKVKKPVRNVNCTLNVQQKPSVLNKSNAETRKNARTSKTNITQNNNSKVTPNIVKKDMKTTNLTSSGKSMPKVPSLRKHAVHDRTKSQNLSESPSMHEHAVEDSTTSPVTDGTSSVTPNGCSSAPNVLCTEISGKSTNCSKIDDTNAKLSSNSDVLDENLKIDTKNYVKNVKSQMTVLANTPNGCSSAPRLGCSERSGKSMNSNINNDMNALLSSNSDVLDENLKNGTKNYAKNVKSQMTVLANTPNGCSSTPNMGCSEISGKTTNYSINNDTNAKLSSNSVVVEENLKICKKNYAKNAKCQMTAAALYTSFQECFETPPKNEMAGESAINSNSNNNRLSHAKCSITPEITEKTDKVSNASHVKYQNIPSVIDTTEVSNTKDENISLNMDNMNNCKNLVNGISSLSTNDESNGSNQVNVDKGVNGNIEATPNTPLCVVNQEFDKLGKEYKTQKVTIKMVDFKKNNGKGGLFAESNSWKNSNRNPASTKMLMVNAGIIKPFESLEIAKNKEKEGFEKYVVNTDPKEGTSMMVDDTRPKLIEPVSGSDVTNEVSELKKNLLMPVSNICNNEKDIYTENNQQLLTNEVDCESPVASHTRAAMANKTHLKTANEVRMNKNVSGENRCSPEERIEVEGAEITEESEMNVDTYPEYEDNEKRHEEIERFLQSPNTKVVDSYIAKMNEPNECPMKTTRHLLTLRIVYPIEGTLECTEDGCTFESTQQEWYKRKASLIRHLATQHDKANLLLEKWCGICKKEITREFRVKYHPCLKSLKPDKPGNGANKCNKCGFTANSRTAYNNHLRSHNEESLRNQRKRAEAKIWADDENNNSQAVNSMNNEQQVCGEEDAESVYEIVDDYDPLRKEPANILEINSAPVANVEEREAAPSDKFYDRFLVLFRNCDTLDWSVFENLVEEFTKDLKRHVKIPEENTEENCPDGVFKAKPRKDPDPNDPTTTQRLYRRNRRRAVRVILGEKSNSCTISHEKIKKKFFPTSEFVPDTSVYDSTVPARAPVNCSPFTRTEVERKLSLCENTAPGPDRVTYNHIKSYDPEARVLTVMYNICLRHQKVPISWKKSTTILIPKKGNLEDVGNWRPITLSVTLYKLYACLLKRRFTFWQEKQGMLADGQKGYRPFDGTLENNYVLEQRIRDAKKAKRSLYIVLLDLVNAFGSIPHPVLFDALEKAGAGTPFVNIVKDLYTDAQTEQRET